MTNGKPAYGRRVVSSAKSSVGGKFDRPRTGDKAGNRNVYVGNLSFDVSWQDLKDHMRSAGDVVRVDILSDATGRSKGCAIVEYAFPRDAQMAIANLNETVLNGRNMFIREDREAGSTGVKPVQGHGSMDMRMDRQSVHLTTGVGKTVYVGNLSWDVQWQDLKDHMRSAGDVVHVDILSDATGRSKGCAIVEYASPRDAQMAIANLNETILNGRNMFIREDREAGSSGMMPVPQHGSGSMKVDRQSLPSAAQLGRSKTVYVGNLSWDVEWQDLKDHMRSAGAVVHANVLKEPSGRSKGCGIVEYATVQDANNAILRLHDTNLKGRLIFVREDREANNNN